jgi:hypothetical protein
VLRRAAGASAEVEPGLLASAVPGGAAYAGVGRPRPEAVIAADRSGRLGAVSLGPARTLARRVGALLARYRLVVVGVPGRRWLDALLARRASGSLVLVFAAAPGARLLSLGASGLGGGRLDSRTTRRPGLVTAIDLAPTVLRWLGLAVPSAVQGQPITAAGARDPAALRALAARLGVISGRRWPAIFAFLLGWLGLVVVAAAGGRARWALRVGGLAALWTPSVLLVGAALRPSEAVELGVVVAGAFLLAAATDRVLLWPRGAAAPAVAMLAAYAVDLARGSPLIATSLLGPNPIAGSRFYGIGNELEAALPIVLLAGLAAVLPQRRAVAPREVAAFVVAGLLFMGLIASGRLGADVGAVFTVGGATAFGALALRGDRSRRAFVLACAVPLVGLCALAGLDLATSAGGHFTTSVLDAGSGGDLLDTLRRKLAAAGRSFRRGLLPLDTVVCLAAALWVWRARASLLDGVGVGWRACLVGGFAGGVLGSVFNDSGPQLLVIACFGLGCVLAYLRGGSYPSLQRG